MEPGGKTEPMDKAKGKNNSRVLTSRDDFLNDETVWDDPNEIYVVNRGGHYGFRSSDWFNSFVKIAF